MLKTPYVALLISLTTALLTGCASVKFVPTRRTNFDLAEELASAAGSVEIRAWNDDPPGQIDSRFPVYYALEISDASGTDQWLLRVAPTSDRVTNLSRFRPAEAEERNRTESDAMLWGLLRGFTLEFGEHSERWIADLKSSVHDFDIGITSATAVQVYIDTIGPIRRAGPAVERPVIEGPSTEPSKWSRSKRAIPVIPQFFAADFPAACEGARELVGLSVDEVSSARRHEVLSAVVRGKMKLAQGLFMIMGSPALKTIADRVMEQPSLLAYASLLTRWVGSSDSGFVEWVGGFAGIRFDTATPAAHDAGLVQFRFEPRVATTVLLKTEISGAGTDRAPLASAGFVTIEGINPYDARRRFKLRLLGWERDVIPGQLLTTDSAEFRFSPDGRSFATKEGDRLWLVPDEQIPGHPRSLSSPGWSQGNWSHDGRFFFVLVPKRSRLEIVDLESTDTTYDQIELPEFTVADAPVASVDGRWVAYTTRDDDTSTVIVVSVRDRTVIDRIEGYAVADDAVRFDDADGWAWTRGGFSRDGDWLALVRGSDGEHVFARVTSGAVTLLDKGAPVPASATDLGGVPRAVRPNIQWRSQGADHERWVGTELSGTRIDATDPTPNIAVGEIEPADPPGRSFQWLAVDPNGEWVIGREVRDDTIHAVRLIPIRKAIESSIPE